MKSFARQVGNSIRTRREAKGWLQRHLAAAADLPVRTIGRIERGEVDVRLSTLSKIAHALRLAVRDLIQ
jgi:transcriptional regulator with XRE-family HTH domain